MYHSGNPITWSCSCSPPRHPTASRHLLLKHLMWNSTICGFDLKAPACCVQRRCLLTIAETPSEVSGPFSLVVPTPPGCFRVSSGVVLHPGAGSVRVKGVHGAGTYVGTACFDLHKPWEKVFKEADSAGEHVIVQWLLGHHGCSFCLVCHGESVDRS